MQDKVLIVGAGPTGLITALTLDKFNVPFKIIDQKTRPDDVSKAMLVVPGTLEHYSQLGILEEVFEEGLELTNKELQGEIVHPFIERCSLSRESHNKFIHSAVEFMFYQCFVKFMLK